LSNGDCLNTSDASRLSVDLIASVLAVGLFLPASATELPIQKVANLATPAKKPARQSLVRIANAEWLPSADTGPRWAFPIILGVAY
jgi:hypothetical protein